MLLVFFIISIFVTIGWGLNRYEIVTYLIAIFVNKLTQYNNGRVVDIEILYKTTIRKIYGIKTLELDIE